MNPCNLTASLDDDALNGEIPERLREPPGDFGDGPASVQVVSRVEGEDTYRFRVSFRGREYHFRGGPEILRLVGNCRYENRMCVWDGEMVPMAVGQDGRSWYIRHGKFGGAFFEYDRGSDLANPWWARDLNFWTRDEDVAKIDPDAPGVRVD